MALIGISLVQRPNANLAMRSVGPNMCYSMDAATRTGSLWQYNFVLLSVLHN